MEEQIELTDLTNKTSNLNVCIILVYTNKYSQYILVDETDYCLHITWSLDWSFHIPCHNIH